MSSRNIGLHERRLGLLMLISGALFFAISGFALERGSPNGACDFEPIFYHARILLEHKDPYRESRENYVRLASEGFLNAKAMSVQGLADLPNPYPPTALMVAAPLAFLKWHFAHLIWMALVAACLIGGAYAIWTVAADESPVFSGLLIGFILANSTTVLFEANAAGIAVGLCALAVVWIAKGQHGALAIICLTASLCLKPHDGFLIWLFLFLAGGSFRKRALQVLVVTSILAAFAVLWVATVSPHWQKEILGNVTSISSRGGVNDPGPNSATPLITNSAVNLQTVFATMEDEPAFYNTATYIASGILLLLWAVAVIRHQMKVWRWWTGITCAACITMLPVYHRHHDAKLLMLAIPACAMIWNLDRAKGIAAVAVSSIAIAMISDVPRVILTRLEMPMSFSSATPSGKLAIIFLAHPAPLSILLMSVFFLWLLWRGVPEPADTPGVNR